MVKLYQNQNVLKHVGVLGMHWGQHKTIGLIKLDPIKVKAAVSSLVSKRSKRKVSDISGDLKSESLGQRLAKAYDINLKPNGKIKTIGLGTIPKIMATAFVAKWAVGTVSGLAATALKSGQIPQFVGDIAWTTGKVISNTPLR